MKKLNITDIRQLSFDEYSAFHLATIQSEQPHFLLLSLLIRGVYSYSIQLKTAILLTGFRQFSQHSGDA